MENTLDFLKALCEESKNEGIRIEKIEPLSDMIASVEGLRQSLASFDYLIFKNQEVSVTDLSSNETTLCCAFYPGGISKEASIGYLKDPHINLLWAKAADTTEGGLEEKENIGVAITLLCKDENNKKVLLVDSLEAGEDFQRTGSENELFSTYLNAIQKLAQDIKADYVLFNTQVFNTTPRSFSGIRSFLEKRNLKKKTIRLEKLGNKDEKFYLESFGNWSKPEGEVSGWVLELPTSKKEEKEKVKIEPEIKIIKNIDDQLLNELLLIEEETFPENLQSDKEDLTKTLENKKGIQIIIKDKTTGKLYGYLFSLPLSDTYEDLKEYDQELKDEKDVLYAESIAFLPEIRGKGLLQELFNTITKEAKEKGYKKNCCPCQSRKRFIRKTTRFRS